MLVHRAGFEPAIFAVKGRRPGPLDERCAMWRFGQGSNLRHPAFQTGALPGLSYRNKVFGAGSGGRTRGLDLGKVALYQLSYARLICGSVTWTRTRDHPINSRGLYQLSYYGMNLEPRAGVKPAASAFVAQRSIR